MRPATTGTQASSSSGTMVGCNRARLTVQRLSWCSNGSQEFRQRLLDYLGREFRKAIVSCCAPSHRSHVRGAGRRSRVATGRTGQLVSRRATSRHSGRSPSRPSKRVYRNAGITF